MGDKPTLEAVGKLAGVPLPKKLTAEGKEKVLSDSLDWLRHEDVAPDEVDEPTLKALTKLAGVPMPEGMLSPKEAKEKAIEDSLEWLRNNDPVVDDVDSPTVKA